MIPPVHTLLLLALAGAPAEPPPIAVTLHRLADDRWRVEYELPAPVEALEFVRQPPFRIEEWTVQTPGVSLERIGDVDLVVGERPFRRLTIDLPSNTGSLVKDYELVDRFTDGGVTIYTGHFDLHPVAPDPDGDRERVVGSEPAERPAMEYRFVPLPGDRVHVPGGGGDRYTAVGSGVYVYFGTLEPVESEHIVAFVDPGLPADLGAAFDRYLPELFALYERRLVVALASRPTVYLNAVPTETGYGTRGGVTGGVVQLAVEADFAAPPEDLRERLVHLLAHEAAHLWNGGRFHHPQLPGSSWLHEGSADALAELALAEIGFYDDDQLAAIASRQATACARGLADTRLIDAADDDRFDLMYECGAVIGWLTHRGWSDGDLFDFWARLFATTGDDGGYTVADYLALLWELAGRSTADTVYRLVHEELTDPFEFLRSAFHEVGVEAALGAGAASDDQAASTRALVWLVGQDCDGAYSIYTVADALEVAGLPQCNAFSDGERHAVTHVDGHPVHAGAAVDAAIARSCGGEEPVRLTLRGGASLEVPCPEPWREERRTLTLDW